MFRFSMGDQDIHFGGHLFRYIFKYWEPCRCLVCDGLWVQLETSPPCGQTLVGQPAPLSYLGHSDRLSCASGFGVHPGMGFRLHL